MPLTDTAIRKAVPSAKPIRLLDKGGLYLLLNPDATRWWRFDYRRPITGQRNTRLGQTLETLLSDAEVIAVRFEFDADAHALAISPQNDQKQ